MSAPELAELLFLCPKPVGSREIGMASNYNYFYHYGSPIFTVGEQAPLPFNHLESKYLCLCRSMHVQSASVVVAVSSLMSTLVCTLIYYTGEITDELLFGKIPYLPFLVDHKHNHHFHYVIQVLLVFLAHASPLLVLIGTWLESASFLILYVKLDVLHLLVLLGSLFLHTYPPTAFHLSYCIATLVRLSFTACSIWAVYKHHIYLRDYKMYTQTVLLHQRPRWRRNGHNELLIAHDVKEVLRARELEREARFKRY